MKKAIVASIGLAMLCAAPLSAQTAEKMTKNELIKWATDRGTCGTQRVLGAKYLTDGRIQVTCAAAGRSRRAAAGGAGAGAAAAAGGLAGGGGALAAVLGAVVVAAAAGGGGSTNTTN